MPTSFRPYAPDQDLLLTPRLGEWLPEGHLAYFISDVVEELDLSAFYWRYEGDGRRKMPYEPRMLIKVLIYAYASGVFSSRKIAKKREEDVAFRVLGAGNFPKHRTICDFRKRHLQEFHALFVQVVEIAREAGLIRLGTVAIDGTKVRANASKRKAMSYARMREEGQRLEQEIGELCAQAGVTDEEEDRRYGED
jgi:transposase